MPTAKVNMKDPEIRMFVFCHNKSTTDGFFLMFNHDWLIWINVLQNAPAVTDSVSG